MSTSICQGLQSCLEPGLVEPRVLRLKLALPSPYLSKWDNSKLEQQKQEEKEKVEEQPQKEEENDYSTYDFQEDKNNDDEDDDMKNGLSFLEVLTAKDNTGTENVYVHPMVKGSASILSAKSLGMCTESLGSETGSDSADEEMSLLSEAVAEEEAVAEAEAEPRKSPIAVREVRSFDRQNRNGSFPPPLTSVGGSAGLIVRPHREDGRLVLQAVTVTSLTSCFHAERADGRLTLRLLKNFPLNNEKEEEDGVEKEIEQDQEDYEEEEEEEEEETTEATEEVNWGEDGVEEMDQAEKIQRLSRCKEDGHGNNNVLMNWDSFLVAT